MARQTTSKEAAATTYAQDEARHGRKVNLILAFALGGAIAAATHPEAVHNAVSKFLGTREPVIESVPDALKQNRDNRDRVMQELTAPTPPQ